MSGLIARLLALMMTGMVFGYQPQSSNSQGTESTPDIDRFRFLLVLGETAVDNLKTQKAIEWTPTSNAENLGQIDHVDFFASEQDSESRIPQTISANVDPIDPSLLHFTFTDELLQRLRATGLRYNMTPSQIGRIRKIVLHYVPVSASKTKASRSSQIFGGNQLDLNATNPPLSNNLEFSNADQRFSGPRQSDDRYRVDSSNRALPPLRNTLPNRNISRNLSNEFRSNESKNRLGDFQPDSRSLVQPNNKPSGERHSSPYLAERITRQPGANNGYDDSQFKTVSENQRPSPKVTVADIIEKQRERYEAQTNGLRSELQQEKATVSQLELDNYRLNDRLNKIQFRLDRLTDVRAEPIERRSTNSDLVIEPPPRNVYTSTAGRAGEIKQPQLDTRVSKMPDRNANTIGSNSGNRKQEVDEDLAEQVETLQSGRWVLLFIAFTSVGLNIFLGMTVRSSHARYEDLADELRASLNSSRSQS